MKTVLYVMEVVLGLIVVVSILSQKSKSDALSGLIQGSKNETFFAKNQSKTKDNMLFKLTALSMFLFMVNTIVMNLI